MLKLIVMVLGWVLSMQLHAFPCFLTMVKDSCWANYSVTVDVLNAGTGKPITTIIIPQGKSWTRQQFSCEPKDVMSLKATFTPVFWENDATKIYPSKRDWSLPETIAKGDTAWSITMCYPADFSEVPLPPDANGHCICNTQEIPPVKPQ